jgi:RHS repeat-associated protein
MMYHYDSQNRLRMAEYPGHKEELFYDGAGNRTRRLINGREELYRYDKGNRLTERVVNGETERFAYDDAGNLVEDGRARYEYDAFNRMTKMETFNGNVQINRYDPEGLRHEMEENGELVHFIFRDREVIAEEKEKGDIRYIRGRELLASDAERARTYYHYASDEMGSVTHVTAREEVLNRYEYDAWGNALTCEEQVENRFRFAGEQYDPVSQQYYLRARFYNPVIGRFTQEDSYRGDGLNLYAYCQNNPVYYIDPTGNFCEAAADRISNLIDEGRIKGKNRQKLEEYLSGKQLAGTLEPWEKRLAEKMDIPTNRTGRADFIVGENGTVVSSRVYNMSNAAFVQEVANISNASVNETLMAEGKKTTGHVAGSRKHGEAYDIADNYQEYIEHRGLELEQNYWKNDKKDYNKKDYNKKDSTRLDVYDTNTGDVYDYKFVINPGQGVPERQVKKYWIKGH